GSCSAVSAPDSETIAVTGSTVADQFRPTTRPAGPRGPATPVAIPTYILDPQLLTDPVTGKPCAFLGQVPGDPGSVAELNAENTAMKLIGQYGLCSNSPPPPQRPSPGAAAAQAFEQDVKLPTPTFSIPPGYSITGTKTFMKFSSPQRIDPAPIDVLGYAVTLHVTSSYDIDWGDASPDRISRGVTSDGHGGYPDGDVWHVYADRGDYTVTVTQRWTATYEIAGVGPGTIADVLSTTNSMALPVKEAQAVVDG
ncbi:MAG: hypothetical protein QOG64_2310, partial [Acidimicrobiaceae bacterium]|nr:hypothetical protein [Acidimicrobiaceae bacterium]